MFSYLPRGYFFDEKAGGFGSRPMYLMYEVVNNLSTEAQDPGKTLFRRISATKPVRPPGMPDECF